MSNSGKITTQITTKCEPMHITSSLLYSKRFAKRPTEVRQQIVAFCCHQHWFALPIDVIDKVIAVQDIDDDLPITYQGEDLTIIDLGYQFFGEAKDENNGLGLSPRQTSQIQCLLIVKVNSKKLWGIPLDSPPEILRVTPSAFTTVSTTKLAIKNLSYISSIILLPERPSLSFLDLQQLTLILES